MSESHTLRELDVFRSFAAARGWVDSSASADKRNYPEPDLLVTQPDDTVVAIEVVEMVGEDFARMTGHLVATKKELEAYFDSLPAQTAQDLARTYHNALLYFRFTQDSTLNQRRSTLPIAFRKLGALSPHFSGDALLDDDELLPVLRSVSISRGEFVGPIFDPESVGSLGDPTESTFQKKFAKRYSSAYPIELLAYVDGQPMFPEDVWKGRLKEFISTFEGPYPFRKVWVLDKRRSEILCEHDL